MDNKGCGQLWLCNCKLWCNTDAGCRPHSKTVCEQTNEDMSQVLRFATIGCGAIVEKSFLPAVIAHKHAALIGATRKDIDRLESFCREHRIDRAYPNVDALLDDPEVDAVYIATPVGTHYDLIVASAEHGKHILCEKPLALDRNEATAAAAVCSANGVKLSVAYYRRQFPEITEIGSLLTRKCLGTVLSINFHHGSWYAPAANSPGSWRIDPELGGGGALMDIGSHRLDLIQYLTSGIERVLCRLSRQVHTHWPVEAGATVLAGLKDGGEGHVSVCFNQKQGSDSLEIYGEDGNVRCPRLGQGRIIVEQNGACEEVDCGGPTAKSATHIPLLRSFIDDIQSGTPNPFAAAGVLPTEIALAACYRSAKESRWVEVEETGGER